MQGLAQGLAPCIAHYIYLSRAVLSITGKSVADIVVKEEHAYSVVGRFRRLQKVPVPNCRWILGICLTAIGSHVEIAGREPNFCSPTSCSSSPFPRAVTTE